MTRFGRSSLAGFAWVGVFICGAQAQNPWLDSLRPLAPPAPVSMKLDPLTSLFSDGALYKELEKAGKQNLDLPGLLELCEVCSSLGLNAEEVSDAETGIARLAGRSAKDQPFAGDKTLLARFLTHAKCYKEAIDLLTPAKTPMASNFRYWIALGMAVEREREDMLDKQPPPSLRSRPLDPLEVGLSGSLSYWLDLSEAHNGNQMPFGYGPRPKSLHYEPDKSPILDGVLGAKPELPRPCLENAGRLTECDAGATSCAPTDLDYAEACAAGVTWCISPEAIAGLPGTARDYADGYIQGLRRYAEAALTALSGAPVDARRLMWAYSAPRVVRMAAEAFPGSIPSDALSTREAVERALAFVARAKSSPDASIRKALGPVEASLLILRGSSHEAYRLIGTLAEADPTATWPIVMLLTAGRAPEKAPAEFADKGIRLAEESLERHDDPGLRRLLVDAYGRRADRGDLAKMRAHIDLMLKADPKDAEANLDLAAWMLRQQGSPVKLDDVARCLDSAAAGLDRLSADFKAAYRTDLAIFTEMRGDRGRARMLLDMAIRDAPDYRRARKVRALFGS